MEAETLLRKKLSTKKVIYEKGNVVEIKILKVEKTETEPYGIKYSLVYIENGKRVVGYDNYEKKGDHKHYFEKEIKYKFERVDKLIRDFLNDVEKYKRGEL